MKAKHHSFPEKLDTTGYRLYWNDTEVSEAGTKSSSKKLLSTTKSWLAIKQN